MNDLNSYLQAVALICGALAGLSTFVAVGMPIVGKYPHRLRHSLSDLFTGELQDKVLDMTSTAKSAANAAEQAATVAAASTVISQQAIRDLTSTMEHNFLTANELIHEHVTDASIHYHPSDRP